MANQLPQDVIDALMSQPPQPATANPWELLTGKKQQQIPMAPDIQVGPQQTAQEQLQAYLSGMGNSSTPGIPDDAYDVLSSYGAGSGPVDPTAGQEIALYKEMADKAGMGLEGQKQGITDAQGRIDNYKTMPVQTDLSPVINLVDQMTGSKLQGAYNRPPDALELMKTKEALEGGLQKMRQNLTDDEINQIKYKLAGAQRRGQSHEKQRSKDEQDVMKIWDSANANGRGAAFIKGIRERLQLAENAHRILENTTAQGGNIVMSEQLATDLAVSLAKMLSGGVAAQGLVEHMIPQSSRGSAASMMQYIRGQPQEFLTPKFQEQFKHTIDAEKQFLGEKLANERASLYRKGRRLFDRNPDLKRDFISEFSLDGQGDWTLPRGEKHTNSGIAKSESVIAIGTKRNNHEYVGGDIGDAKSWRLMQ